MTHYKEDFIWHKHNNALMRRVNKTKARRVYEEGGTVWLQSCNMRFCDNMWQFPYALVKELVQASPAYTDEGFDEMVSDYKYYNCDHERGRYPSYFIEVEECGRKGVRV